MAYESFYGGRKGVSFQIVARFDGIDIPQEEGHLIYKRKTYAYKTFDGDETRYFIYPFIERTHTNYNNPDYRWDAVELDGGEVWTVAEKATSPAGAEYRSKGDVILAEGMVQCFSQGGATTDKVNYGEYVIIDTITGRNEYNNPDNGKVYRRGMDYIQTKQNPLAGAEYIGCIVGAQGEFSKLSVKGYNEVKAIDNAEEAIYYAGDGLVPGKAEDGTFNDEFRAVYATIRDSNGNIEECQIAYEMPYLVEEFIARSISPYGDDDVLLPEDYELAERIDDKTHPFYRKWKMNIPKGIHGDDISNWRFEPTVCRPNVSYWLRSEDVGVIEPEGTLPNSFPVVNVSNNYLTVEANDMIVYIKPSDGWKYKVKYTITNYDNNKYGDSFRITDENSNYDALNKIDLAADGTITAHYTNRDDEPLDNQVQWIDHIFIDTDGTAHEEGQGDQKVHVIYNTNTAEDHAIGRPLNYIIESVVTELNDTKNPTKISPYHILVYYSDKEKRDSNVSYYSERTHSVISGWVDLGYVRGPVEGLRLIGEVNNIQDLYDEDLGRWLRPEEVIDDPEMAPRMEGWGVSDSEKILWVYDYKTSHEWYSIGNIGTGFVDVSKIFYVGAENAEPPSGMGKNAIWASYGEIKFAE